MNDALENHKGTVSIGDRTITNLRFADDIDGLKGKEKELAALVDHLDKTFSAFSMEISAEKSKMMTNNIDGISIDIRVNGRKLNEVNSFKYMGAVVIDQGSTPELLSRIAQNNNNTSETKNHPITISIFLLAHRLDLCAPCLSQSCCTPAKPGHGHSCTQRQFSENICSEDDLRSRIF